MSHRFTRSSSGARVKDGRLLFANRAVNIPMKPEGNKYFNLIESDIIIKPNEFEYGISFDYLDNTSMTGDLKTFNHKQDTPIIATLADVQIIHLTITQNINKKNKVSRNLFTASIILCKPMKMTPCSKQSQQTMTLTHKHKQNNKSED